MEQQNDQNIIVMLSVVGVCATLVLLTWALYKIKNMNNNLKREERAVNTKLNEFREGVSQIQVEVTSLVMGVQEQRDRLESLKHERSELLAKKNSEKINSASTSTSTFSLTTNISNTSSLRLWHTHPAELTEEIKSINETLVTTEAGLAQLLQDQESMHKEHAAVNNMVCK